MDKQLLQRAIARIGRGIEIATRSGDIAALEELRFVLEIFEKEFTGGWILINEKLPEKTTETILIAVKDVYRGISHGHGSIDIAYMRDDRAKKFSGTDGHYSIDNVIAWLPIPEPPVEEMSE